MSLLRQTLTDTKCEETLLETFEQHSVDIF